MSHFGEMTNYFEDFGGNFEIIVGAIKEEVRIEANHGDGTLTKMMQLVSENRFLAGAAAAIGVLSVAFFFRDRLNIHNVYSENIGLKKENNELKEKVKSLEVELQSLNAKMETLEGKLESAGLMCVICQDHALNSTFVPCGHAVCDQCAKKMKRCPFCNHNVEQIIARY